MKNSILLYQQNIFAASFQKISKVCDSILKFEEKEDL